MKYERIKRKYPFLSDIDCENLYIISKSKISYKEIKKLNKSDLIFYTKKYAKKIKNINKNSSMDLKPFILPKDIDTLFKYKKQGISDLELNKMLLKVEDVNILKTPNTKPILRVIKTLKTANLTVMFVCLIAFALSTISFMLLANDSNKTRKLSGKVKNDVVINEVKPDGEDMKVVSDDYFKYLNVSMLDVDFTNLKKENSDTKGWLKVEGTNVNYPFVQTSDNDYYLKHSFDKSSNKKGWVFLDYRNNIDNLNDNTIIYAHGLVNNAMFGSLRNTTKEKWYKKKNNRIIKVSTDNKMMLWEVFSTYNIEPESYYITNEITDDVERLEFYNTLKRRSVYDYDVTLNKDDKILTLSSCYDNTKRMVLHAKLIAIK